MKIMLVLLSIFILPLNALLSQKYYGEENGKKLDYALYYLNEYYVDSTDSDYLTDIAITKMMEALDPYSVYQTAKELEDMQNADQGYSPESYGFYHYAIGDSTMVSYLFEGGPAEAAGLKVSDRILAVNGVPATGTQFYIIQDFVNEPGLNELVLLVKSTADVLPKEIVVEKKLIPLISVEASFMVNNFTAYSKIGRFTQNTVDEFLDDMNRMKEQGMSNLILDLRGNFGGVVDAAMALADEFLPEGKVMTYSEGFNLERTEYVSTALSAMQGINLMVLIDANTKSSAEMFTAAMQDWDRALIIGNESYGKGLIQQAYKLDDGSAIRMTIGKYFTPAGRFLQRSVDDGQALSKIIEPGQSNYTLDLVVNENYLFQTISNRKILASSGGIIPDIYTNTQESDLETLNALNENGILYAFTNSYMFENRSLLLEKFKYAQDFLDDKEFDKQLSQIAKNYIIQEVNRLNLSRSLVPADLTEKMLFQIKAWIAGQLWGNAGYFYLLNQQDLVYKRAMIALQDGSFRKVNIFAY